jgi:uncharacterized membrane protein YgcG
VMKAFRLSPDQRAAVQRDASPTSIPTSTMVKVMVVLAVIVIILLISRCSRNDRDQCNSLLSQYGEQSYEYQNCLTNSRSSGSGSRTSGGSFGGFSSGGGHK